MRRETVRRVAAWAVVILLLLPVAVVAVRFFDRPWFHLYDQASVDMRVRDVWTSDTPLLGPSSRGFNTPGPSMLWAMAPLSGMFGRPAWATVVAAALLQGVAIAGACWVAWRKGGLSLLLVIAAVIALSYRAMGDTAFLTPWGPFVAFPFFILFMLLIWDVVTGRPGRLIAATAVGTFLVQAHIGYVPLVGTLAVWAGIVMVRDARREQGTSAWANLRPTVLWSVAVAAVLWAPMVIDTVVNRGGNLYRIARRFTGGSGEPVAGLRPGFGFLAAEFRWLPPWVGGDDLRDSAGAARPASLLLLVVPVALVVIGFVAVRISGSRDHRRLLTMVALLLPASALAMAQSAVPTDFYLFWWRQTIAVFLVAAVLLAVAGALHATRRPPVKAVAAAALAGVIVILSVSSVVRTNRESRTPREFAVVQQTLDELGSSSLPREPVLMRLVGNEWELYASLVNELERRGVQVRVDRGFQEDRFGEERFAKAEDAPQVWFVVQDGWLVSDLVGRTEVEVLVRFTPLGNADETNLVAMQQQLEATLRSAHRTDLLAQLDSPEVERALGDVRGADPQTLRRLGAVNARIATSAPRRTLVVRVPPNRANALTAELVPR